MALKCRHENKLLQKCIFPPIINLTMFSITTPITFLWAVLFSHLFPSTFSLHFPWSVFTSQLWLVVCVVAWWLSIVKLGVATLRYLLKCSATNVFLGCTCTFTTSECTFRCCLSRCMPVCWASSTTRQTTWSKSMCLWARMSCMCNKGISPRKEACPQEIIHQWVIVLSKHAVPVWHRLTVHFYDCVCNNSIVCSFCCIINRQMLPLLIHENDWWYKQRTTNQCVMKRRGVTKLIQVVRPNGVSRIWLKRIWWPLKAALSGVWGISSRNLFEN